MTRIIRKNFRQLRMARSREPLHGGSLHVFADPVLGADDYATPSDAWLQAGRVSPMRTLRMESVEILPDAAIAQAVDFLWPADAFENVHLVALPATSNSVSVNPFAAVAFTSCGECDEPRQQANGQSR